MFKLDKMGFTDDWEWEDYALAGGLGLGALGAAGYYYWQKQKPRTARKRPHSPPKQKPRSPKQALLPPRAVKLERDVPKMEIRPRQTLKIKIPETEDQREVSKHTMNALTLVHMYNTGMQKEPQKTTERLLLLKNKYPLAGENISLLAILNAADAYDKPTVAQKIMMLLKDILRNYPEPLPAPFIANLKGMVAFAIKMEPDLFNMDTLPYVAILADHKRFNGADLPEMTQPEMDNLRIKFTDILNQRQTSQSLTRKRRKRMTKRARIFIHRR